MAFLPKNLLNDFYAFVDTINDEADPLACSPPIMTRPHSGWEPKAESRDGTSAKFFSRAFVRTVVLHDIMPFT